MWSVRLRGKAGAEYPIEGYNAQALWLNSTPGLLRATRTTSGQQGAFVQVKREYVPLIPMLDYSALSQSARDRLEATFRSLATTRVQSIPEQLREALAGRGFRFDLDSAVLDAMAPGFDRRLLAGVYRELLAESIIAPKT